MATNVSALWHLGKDEGPREMTDLSSAKVAQSSGGGRNSERVALRGKEISANASAALGTEFRGLDPSSEA